MLSSPLETAVHQLLQLVAQEPELSQYHHDRAIAASLRKAISPTFEIVFAGAFSAGKSMLINALLERELLYSAEGHATGTECQIAYAEADQERVVLTFMSGAEIHHQLTTLCQQLSLEPIPELSDSARLRALQQASQQIIQAEGGESKSDRAKQARALDLLIQGYLSNYDRIAPTTNNTFSMEHFNFDNLQEAATYARRGSNSAVLKRIEYYCHHELLRDGNILIDTPGIDAPVKQDAELTYRKIEHPDTSAVVCVLKPASAGDMSAEETELLEKTRANPGIRDRVFYVFNRVDETWYNTQLRQRLETLIQTQFQANVLGNESYRVYKTSGLLGFYGSQLRRASQRDRYGLDTLFADSIRNADGTEETPQFVSEFNRYCANSGKLPIDRFRIEVKSYESPNENYVRILNEQGQGLIEQLIQDSGIETFRSAITRYLTEEKRPQLLATLADDLRPLCQALAITYENRWQDLAAQPNDIQTLKEQELRQLSRALQKAAIAFKHHMDQEVNAVVASNENAAFERDFMKLKAKMVSRLDELLNTFSVGEVHKLAQASHRRNSVVPLLGILAEAFYYLANGLEEVLVEASQELAVNFFAHLIQRVRQQDYYKQLQRLTGQDGGIEAGLKTLHLQVVDALKNAAQIECDRYVRERPEFYTEGTASMFQLRQTLQQACRGYDYQNMVDAEPAIRQLLKMDFEQKVKETALRTFRQTVNQTLNQHLQAMTKQQSEEIERCDDQARSHLIKVLEKEAEERIRKHQAQQSDLHQRIETYNQSVAALNQALEAMSLEEKVLPAIALPQFSLSAIEVTSSHESTNGAHPELAPS